MENRDQGHAMHAQRASKPQIPGKATLVSWDWEVTAAVYGALVADVKCFRDVPTPLRTRPCVFHLAGVSLRGFQHPQP